MTQLPWLRDPESFLDATALQLCRTWRTDGPFGLLLVGDAGQREALFAHLRPSSAVTITAAMTESDLTSARIPSPGSGPTILERASSPAGAVIPAADLIDPAVAAVLDCDRILASAPEVESVPPALLSRLPVVIGLGVTPTTRCRRVTFRGDTRVSDWVVESLAANGVNDHRLDIGASRCVAAVHRAAGTSSRALARHVIEPRLGPMVDAAVIAPATDDETLPAQASANGTDGDELQPDEADVTRIPDPATVTPVTPDWATALSARSYLRRRHPGRRGALARARGGRVRRVVEYDVDLGLDIHHTLTAAARSGELDRHALRSSIRVRRGGRLTIVIVDRSDSMNGVRGRAASGRALGAIEETIGNRSKVAVIVARGAAAELVVEPTRDLRNAHDVIASLPSGGGTPLASAFLLAVGLIEEQKDATRVVVVSDGGSDVGLDTDLATTDSAAAQAETALRLLVERCEQVVVVPTANPGVRIRPGDVKWLSRAGAVIRPDSR